MGTPPVKIKPRGFESVREYLLFEESVEKELKFLTVCQTFQKRPEHCAAIADKVTQPRPSTTRTLHDEPEYNEIVKQAERSLFCSTDNLDFPETSAQEVGWIIKKQAERGTKWRQDGTSSYAPRCASDDMWHRPLSQSDIVKSLENYVSVRKVNMFARLE